MVSPVTPCGPEGSNKKCNGTTGQFTWEVQLVPAQLTLKDIYNIITGLGRANWDTRGCDSGRGTWYMCLGSREPSGNGLDGFSTLKNPCFDPWHMPVAQFYQKLYFQGVTCGTCVYGHVAHLAMV